MYTELNSMVDGRVRVVGNDRNHKLFRFFFFSLSPSLTYT